MRRRCKVAVNDVTVLDDLDVMQDAGGDCKPLKRSFRTFVRDGELRIDFSAIEQMPSVNGIEIVQLQGPPTKAEPHDTEFEAIRINCGGKAHTEQNGVGWQADRDFTPGGSGAIGGFVTGLGAGFGKKEIGGAQDGKIYFSERYGLCGYRFTAPKGKYKIRLHFNERVYGPGGLGEKWNLQGKVRRMNIAIAGKLIAKDLVVIDEAGGNYTALIVEKEVNHGGGTFDVQMSSLSDQAMINGIEVLPAEEN
jgi:hypothetical protein